MSAATQDQMDSESWLVWSYKGQTDAVVLRGRKAAFDWALNNLGTLSDSSREIASALIEGRTTTEIGGSVTMYSGDGRTYVDMARVRVL